MSFIEIDDTTVIQQSRFMMMGVGSGGALQQSSNFNSVAKVTVGDFRSSSSLIDIGRANAFAVPLQEKSISVKVPKTMNEKSLSKTPLDMNKIPSTFGIPKTFNMKELPSLASKSFDSSTRSIASLIDKTKIFSEKIDYTKINTVLKLESIITESDSTDSVRGELREWREFHDKHA